MKKEDQTAIKYRSIICLNCEHPLDASDKFCPNCSQSNSIKKLNIKDLFREFFANLFSYDSKLMRTFTVMFFKPGKITKAYVSGKRMTYANPFRIFLSLAIVYVFMLNYSGNFSELDRFGISKQKDPFSLTNNDVVNMDFTSTENQKELEQVKQFIPVDLDSLQQEREKKDSIRLHHPVEYFNSLQQKHWLNRISLKISFFQSEIRKQRITYYKQAADSLKLNDTYENKLAFGSAESLVKASNEPGSYLSYIISKLPFIIFFFLPVFAVFIWFLYSKKKFNYFDHLIFSFHTQTMLIILFIISLILEWIFKPSYPFYGWAVLIFLFYLYKAMRNFYRQGRLKTIVKFMILNSIFFTLATVTIIFFFIGGIFTY